MDPITSAYKAIEEVTQALDGLAVPSAENETPASCAVVDRAIADAVGALTMHGGTILDALAIAARVERDSNALGASALALAQRRRRGSLN